ncbi:MAG: serine kinase [Neomegalonema sp.]|nr:serine kinase [Neomegalonema sp.]
MTQERRTQELSGQAILIRGPSGIGKSSFALRLIGLGAVLVADDFVSLGLEGKRVMAKAPSRLRGVIEARGVGLLRLPYLDHAPLALIVDLVANTNHPAARLPENRYENLGSVQIPLLSMTEDSRSAAIIAAMARAPSMGATLLDPSAPLGGG